jgi:formate dehydrogenase maturation protein FdhE
MVRSQQDIGSQEWKEKYISMYREIPIVRVAAQVAGINRTTVTRALQNDDEFARQIAEARDEGVERLESVAWQLAQTNERVLMFMLKSHKPDMYGDKQKLDATISTKKFTIKLSDDPDILNGK